jgi:hypothetical protein
MAIAIAVTNIIGNVVAVLRRAMGKRVDCRRFDAVVGALSAGEP